MTTPRADDGGAPTLAFHAAMVMALLLVREAAVYLLDGWPAQVFAATGAMVVAMYLALAALSHAAAVYGGRSA